PEDQRAPDQPDGSFHGFDVGLAAGAELGAKLEGAVLMKRISKAHAERAAPCRKYDLLCGRGPCKRLAAPAIDGTLEIADDGEGKRGQPRGKPVRPEMESRREAAEFAS